MYLRTEAILQKNSGVKEFMDPNLDLKPPPPPTPTPSNPPLKPIETKVSDWHFTR